MKLNSLLLFLIAGLLDNFSATAQTNKIVFSYDNSGKVIERKLTVVLQQRVELNQKKDSLVKNPIRVYPNPASDAVTIEGDLPPDVEKARIKLYDESGRTLRETTYSGKSTQIDVHSLSPGIYFLDCTLKKNDRTTFKIIKSN